MSQQLDTQGEAHEALGTAVASYGQRVLSDPHTLGNLVADLLPDLPRERSLLVTGAEADIAAAMREHVEGQHPAGLSAASCHDVARCPTLRGPPRR